LTEFHGVKSFWGKDEERLEDWEKGILLKGKTSQRKVLMREGLFELQKVSFRPSKNLIEGEGGNRKKKVQEIGKYRKGKNQGRSFEVEKGKSSGTKMALRAAF